MVENQDISKTVKANKLLYRHVTVDSLLHIIRHFSEMHQMYNFCYPNEFNCHREDIGKVN